MKASFITVGLIIKYLSVNSYRKKRFKTKQPMKEYSIKETILFEK